MRAAFWDLGLRLKTTLTDKCRSVTRTAARLLKINLLT